jgi:hypothetical protein
MAKIRRGGEIGREPYQYITSSLSEVYSAVKKVLPFITQNVVLLPT